MPALLQLLDLADRDARHLHEVVRLLEELFRMGSPAAVIGSRQRIRAIRAGLPVKASCMDRKLVLMWR